MKVNAYHDNCSGHLELWKEGEVTRSRVKFRINGFEDCHFLGSSKSMHAHDRARKHFKKMSEGNHEVDQQYGLTFLKIIDMLQEEMDTQHREHRESKYWS